MLWADLCFSDHILIEDEGTTGRRLLPPPSPPSSNFSYEEGIFFPTDEGKNNLTLILDDEDVVENETETVTSKQDFVVPLESLLTKLCRSRDVSFILLVQKS